MIPRRKHNASSGSLGPPAPAAATGSDDKHASNDHILAEGGAREGWRACCRRVFSRKTLHKRVPVTSWLPQYSGAQALGDVIAGVTVGLTVIPQSLAYSSIAGLPPQHGLYGSFLGCFVYIVLGGCRAVPCGPTAIASLLTWQVAGGVLPKAVLLTLLAGLVTLAMGALRLGFLLDFVSGPVSSGFTSAVALMIATSQVKDLFAISVHGSTFVQQWISVFSSLRHAALWDPVLGFSCIALLLFMRWLGMVKVAGEGAGRGRRWLGRCLWLLGTCRNAVVVVASGALGYWFVATSGSSPVRLMGAIPSGVPRLQAPALSYVRADNSTAGLLDMVSELGSGILVVPLIVLLEDMAICKAFGDGKAIDATQEMIALGAAGIGNSFLQAYPGGGSLARSVVANGSGVKTPFAGFYTGIMVILALQFFTQYFEFIPKAALAAVIISAILFMVEYDVIKPMWRAKKLDLVPGVGTFVLCLALPLELGVLCGVAGNLLFILYHAARPKVSVELARSTRGAQYLLVTPDRCLTFPSVEYVRRAVTKCAGAPPVPLPVVPVVLDCTHIYSADYTAAVAVERLAGDFHARRQPLYFYNVKPSVCAVFGAVARQGQFVVFYEDDELDRLLADDERLQKPPV